MDVGNIRDPSVLDLMAHPTWGIEDKELRDGVLSLGAGGPPWHEQR